MNIFVPIPRSSRCSGITFVMRFLHAPLGCFNRFFSDRFHSAFSLPVPLVMRQFFILFVWCIAASCLPLSAQTPPEGSPTIGTLPVAIRQVYVATEDTPLTTGVLLGAPRDKDNPETITFKLGKILPTSGTITVQETGQFVYTPSPNFNGVDSFSFVAIEKDLESTEATNSVVVNPVNDAPIAFPFSDVAPAGQKYVGQLQAFDIDHTDTPTNNLIFTGADGNPSGLMISDKGQITYTPATETPGAIVTFNFWVDDQVAPKVSSSGTLVLGDGLGFVGDTLREQVVGAYFPPTVNTNLVLGSPSSTPAAAVGNRILDLQLDRIGRRLYALTSSGLQAYALSASGTSPNFVPVKKWTSIKGTHLALSLDARTAYIAEKGSVTAINLYPESVFGDSGLAWVPAYDDTGKGNKRVYKLGRDDRDVVAIGVHPAGDRLLVVLAGSATKVNVTNDLLRSDVGNGVRSEVLTEADLPADFGFITQLDISSEVQTVGSPRPAPIFSALVDLKDLIYRQAKAKQLPPAVAVGIRDLAFSPDGNCAFLSAVGGQTARSTPFGIMPTTDEGTGGIVVLDVRPQADLPPPASGEEPKHWLDYLGFIPTTEAGEETAALRTEIRKQGWKIVHPEVQYARQLNMLAAGGVALGGWNAFTGLPTLAAFNATSDALGILEHSYRDYGYMQAYFDLYPRDMVGASSVAINHGGNFGIVTLQDTNNLGLIPIAKPFKRVGFNAESERPAFTIKTGTGKSINGFDAALGNGGPSGWAYSWAYPQKVAFTSDDSRIFIGAAGGTPKADLANKFGSANAFTLYQQMGLPNSVFSKGNPPPGYSLYPTGLFQSPRKVATRSGVDYDGDRISDQTEAFNRWNFLRPFPSGNRGAMVDADQPEALAGFLDSDPTSPIPIQLFRGDNLVVDNAWHKCFFLPTSGIGYRLDSQGNQARLSFNAGSQGAIAAIEQMGRIWHEAYIAENSQITRPYFVVGIISTPGGGPVLNSNGEEVQYGDRNGFQVNFPYPSLNRSGATPVLSDAPHDFVKSNVSVAPPKPGAVINDDTPGPRNNKVEDLAGIDLLHTAKLIQLLYRELFDGRFLASRIELDPAIRYLLTEPALSDPALKIDAAVGAIAREIDFGSPIFSFHGVRGPTSRSRRDLDSGMSVSFSPLELKIGPPPKIPAVPGQTTPPPPPPPKPGTHTFGVTLPNIPAPLRPTIQVWLPPFASLDSTKSAEMFVIRNKKGDVLKIGEKYTLADFLDPTDETNPNGTNITLTVETNEKLDWQLTLEMLSPTHGSSVYSLRDRFEYIQWIPQTELVQKLKVMQRGDKPNKDQVTKVQAEIFGFSAPIIYRRLNWVRAPFSLPTGKPSEPFIDPNTGEIVAGEDSGTLTVIAEAKTLEGEDLMTSPLEIKVGTIAPDSSVTVGRITLGTHEDLLQIEIDDGGGRSLTIRAGQDGKDLLGKKAITFPQANGHESIKFARRNDIRQILTPFALFDVIYDDAEGYTVRTYKISSPPTYDPVENLYKLNGLGNAVSSLKVAGTAALADITVVEENVTSRHQFSAPSDLKWDLTEFIGETGSFLRKRGVLFAYDNTTASITRTVAGPEGELYRQTDVIDQYKIEGTHIAERVEGPAGSGEKTKYHFINGNTLAGIEYPNGRWERFTYDSAGRVLNHIEPWGNAPYTAGDGECIVTSNTYAETPPAVTLRPSSPRQTMVRTLGEITAVSFDDYTEENGALIHASWVKTDGFNTAGSYLITKTTYMPRVDGAGHLLDFGDRIAKIEHPDGTLESYTYLTPRKDAQARVIDETTIIRRENKGKGTLTTITADGHHRETKVTIVDIASGLKLEERTAAAFDSQGRVTQWTHLGGVTTTATYGPQGPLTETDKLGLTTTYTYDALGRIKSKQYMGVTMSYEHDARDRVLEVRRNDVVVSKFTHDMLGHNTASLDAMDRQTYLLVSYRSDGSTKRFSGHPGGDSQLQLIARDGRVLLNYGTGVAPTVLKYRVSSAGTGYPSVVARSIALSASPLANAEPDDLDGTEWTDTYYDMAGRIVRVVYPDGTSTRNVYDGKGHLERSVDPDGVVTLFEYDDLGKLSRTGIDSNRDGQLGGNDSRITGSSTVYASHSGVTVARTTTEVWNSGSPVVVGVVDASIDGRHKWQTSFDQVSTEEWTVAGGGSWQITSTAPDGTNTVADYQAGRLASTTTKAGGQVISQVSYVYDNQGRPWQVTDLRGGVTSTTYYADDQVNTVTTLHPETGVSLVTSHEYDARGLLKKLILPDLSEKTYTYTKQGKLDVVAGSQTYPIDYDYDAQGRLISMKTSSQTGAAVTSWRYDPAFGNLIAKSDAADKEVTYTYTSAGRLQTRTWARGIVTTYGYYDDGALASVLYGDSTPKVTYAYHSNGQISEVSDNRPGAGYRHTFTLDSKLRPGDETISTLGTHKLARLYEPSSTGRYSGFELSGSSLPTKLSQSYNYNSASQLATVQSLAGTFNYGYLAQSGLVASMAGPVHVVNNTSQPLGYDLSARENKTGDTQVSRFAYRTNALGQRTDVSRSGSALVQPTHIAYRYDNKGQLTHAESFSGANPEQSGAPILPETSLYAFDDIGNRLTATRGSQSSAPIEETYTTNLLNQYTGIAVAGAGPPRTLVYDADGNLTDDSRWHYTWDGENRLVVMETATTAIASGVPKQKLEFAYDYQGRRTEKKVYSWNLGAWDLVTDRGFLYDGRNLVAEYDFPALRLLRTYTWGLDESGSLQGAGGVGGLLALTEHPAPPPPPPEGEEPVVVPPRSYFPAYDGSGNITEWLDQTGVVVAHQEYGPFGERFSQTGPAAGRFAFGFSTKYTDEESGLLYYGYRYYSADTGRWLSRDPIEEQGGANLYGFVFNSPTNHIDPDGRVVLGIISVIATAGFAAYDIYQYETSAKTQEDLERYEIAMALNGAALIADLASLGQGGGLVLRAARGVARVHGIYTVGNGIYRTEKALLEGDSVGAAINGGFALIGLRGISITRTPSAWERAQASMNREVRQIGSGMLRNSQRGSILVPNLAAAESAVASGGRRISSADFNRLTDDFSNNVTRGSFRGWKNDLLSEGYRADTIQDIIHHGSLKRGSNLWGENWKKYYEEISGIKFPGSPNHAHHLAQKLGGGEFGALNRQILEGVNINPLLSRHNLTWAPNGVIGQHGLIPQGQLYEMLSRVSGDRSGVKRVLQEWAIISKNR